MFDRFLLLSLVMLTGFNLIALSAPALALEYSAIGWGLLSFSSVFLIGAWNDRPTARENATFIFAVYAVTDCAMLIAAAYCDTGVHSHNAFAAAGLLVAAILKT